MTRHEVVIVGGGPAGSVCAIVCARAGLEVLLIERARFPRDKVCGDCLNPACWPVLERMGVGEKVRTLPHSVFRSVSITTIGKKEFTFDLPPGKWGETGVRRRDLDALLLETAREAGATIVEDCPVQEVRSGWEIRAGGQTFAGRYLVGADGRNSTVARLLGLLPPARKDRISLQTHFPVSPRFSESVRMELWPEGYAGGASIGDGLWNLCLVSSPQDIDRLKARAVAQWRLPADQSWRSITPLTRRAVRPVHGDLLLVGDAARVVEPFTGEGIYYALRSGELAAECLVRAIREGVRPQETYAPLHAGLYRGRLWINQLARLAVLHPVLTSRLLETLPVGSVLRHLTAKVTAPLQRTGMSTLR